MPLSPTKKEKTIEKFTFQQPLSLHFLKLVHVICFPRNSFDALVKSIPDGARRKCL